MSTEITLRKCHSCHDNGGTGNGKSNLPTWGILETG